MKVHLLEPYRSALVTRGLAERLIVVPNEPGGAVPYTPMIRAGRNPELQKALLQLMVLASDVSFIWNEPSDEEAGNGPIMRLAGLDKLGVVEPVPPPEEPLGVDYSSVRGQESLWRELHEELDAYAELILSQLAARGRNIHWSLFRLARALCLRDFATIPLISSVIPRQFQDVADGIMRKDRAAWEFAAFPILTTYLELDATLHWGTLEDRKLVGAVLPTKSGGRIEDVPKAAAQVWGIVVTALAQEEVMFPEPSSLQEVLALRNDPAVAAFRASLISVVHGLAAGDQTELAIWQRELKASARAMRNYPRVAILGKWTAYLALPAAMVEYAAGLFGLSLGTHLLAVGMQDVAREWEEKSRWLYLGRGRAKEVDDLFMP